MADNKQLNKSGNLDEKNNISDNDVVFEDENDENTPLQKIKKLREELKKCTEERGEYLAGWQRAKADFINQKNDLEKWKKDFILFANENLIDELLPVLDSFNIAFGNREAWEKVDKNWRTGVEYIHSQLEGVLKQHGLITIGEVGEPFNPEKHSAIEKIVTQKKDEDGLVKEVFQKGFILKDKIIRPAKVKVFAYEEN
ncbi:MAG: nucleotide exchange factor GrpE [Patescibacteria group bacterium]